MASIAPSHPSAADPLAGHLGHLSPDQQKAFDDFKSQCIKAGLDKQPPLTTQGEVNDGIFDDGTLLRFLRARRFNVHAALDQFQKTASWRQLNSLASLYDTIDVEDFNDTKNLYTHWTGRRDKLGIPLYVFEISHLTRSQMSASSRSHSHSPSPSPSFSSPSTTTTTKLQRLFATYEHLTRFVMPLCSAVPSRPHPATPVTQTICIVDIRGVGLVQFWSLRSHLQDASELATAHYPETLGRTFVIGAPSFFPTIWSWLRGWFDPITTAKIFILSSGEVLPMLSAYIDNCNIPKKYGGELEFEFGMEPNLDVEIEEMLVWEGEGVAGGKGEGEGMGGTGAGGGGRLPRGPVKWIEGERGGRMAVAVGSRAGELRREMVATLENESSE